MSGLNWRKAQLSTKRSMSMLDESEYRDRDAASRWLARNEKPAKKAGKNTNSLRQASSQARPANAGTGTPRPSVPAPIHEIRKAPSGLRTSLAAREADESAAPIQESEGEAVGCIPLVTAPDASLAAREADKAAAPIQARPS